MRWISMIKHFDTFEELKEIQLFPVEEMEKLTNEFIEFLKNYKSKENKTNLDYRLNAITIGYNLQDGYWFNSAIALVDITTSNIVQTYFFPKVNLKMHN